MNKNFIRFMFDHSWKNGCHGSTNHSAKKDNGELIEMSAKYFSRDLQIDGMTIEILSIGM